jgi:hypothetical protein
MDREDKISSPYSLLLIIYTEDGYRQAGIPHLDNITL